MTVFRNLSIVGLALTLSLPSINAEAAGRYQGVNVQRGLILSMGRADSSQEQGSGVVLDANYSSVAVNGGIATRRFGDWPVGPEASNTVDSREKRITNAYVGVGFSRLIQLQYGSGNAGDLYRVRTDINFKELTDLMTFRRTPKDRLLMGDRITFSFAAERYLDSDAELYDNFTWGIGLLF